MLVTIARYFDALEAQVLRMRLEAEGVPAFVIYANHTTLYWPLMLALGGTRVQVPVSCVDAARAVLADYASGAFEADLRAEANLATPACATCADGGPPRMTIPWSQRVLVFILSIWGAPFPTRQHPVCSACGNAWHAA